VTTSANELLDAARDPRPAGPVAIVASRPFYWSVRRELWENRWLYLVPLAVAALVLFASAINTFGLPAKMRNLGSIDPLKQHAAIVTPASMAPAPVLMATFLLAFFYFDALYGERRDRSILFWKSLPVSDRTTVLSKFSIPMAVLPVVGIVLGTIAQVLLLLFSTAVLLGSNVSAAPLWTEFRFFQEPLVLVYGVAVHVLWFAPIYAWFLLVSAWARRVPFLWAVLPIVAAAGFERMVFRTTYLGNLLKYRFAGGMQEAFAVQLKHGDGALDRLSQLSPGRFLSAPGLWAGLLFAAGCLFGAIRLRRGREPI
jgi:ABC-2 type transport system permease protein